MKKFNTWFDRSAGSARVLLRFADLALVIITALVLLSIATADTPQRRGDGNEDYQMMISWASHGGPDIRVSDNQAYDEMRAKAAGDSPSFKEDLIAKVSLSNGYTKAEDGKSYSIHFWLFSLAAVPVMLFLKAIGQNQLMALQLTNALLIIFSLAAILLYSGLVRSKRWLLFAFSLFSPALWYLDWPGPEIFSYSFVVAGIAVFTRKKYALAVLLAAVASTQNPPIIFLVIYFLIYGVADVIRKKRPAGLAPLGLGALPVLLPMVFYYINYGTPNLIYKVGEASFSAASLTRLLSFFLDLNQGILPYIPAVFIFFVFLLLRNWRRRERRVYEIAIMMLLMALLAGTTTNWNSDAEGILRYAVWVLPLFFWGVVEGAHLRFRTDRVFLSIAVVSQIVILFSYPAWFIAKHEGIADPATYVKNNALAAWLLDNHPSLYSPEREIFVERTLHEEIARPDDFSLPVVYFREDGKVTKILTDYHGLELLGGYGDIDAAVFNDLKQSHQGDSGLFYLNLSPGQMRFATQNRPLGTFKDRISVVDPPKTLPPNSEYSVSVSVQNTGPETWFAQGKASINLSYHIYDLDGHPVRLENPRENITRRLRMGEELMMPVKIWTPEEPGTYLVEFDLVQEGVAWFKDKGNKAAVMKVDVR